MKMKKENVKKLIIYMSVLFMAIVVLGLGFCTKYIDHKLRQSNIGSAVDIAQLVKNNFQITDAKVAYMKALTFNEMERDPINARLMNVGNGVILNAAVTNVYVIAPLKENEIRYYADESNAEFFGYEVGTPLDGIWLLNGTFNEKGEFQVKQREDVYRYTSITKSERKGFTEQKAFGTFTSDAWGDFITGYTPLYTVEGNFVGLFLYFYFKYAQIEKAKIYFDFYSRMSHDMRTPMNGIMGMVHLAETENDVTELHSYFEKIGESSEYLLRLINDTLDVSRISSGKMVLHLEHVRCGHILQNIVDMVQETAQQHQITFHMENRNLDKDCLVMMDTVRFKQIFVNLLTNAIKYTPAGGEISFIVECLEQSNTSILCRFIVEDNGVGMSEEYMKKSLYQPFSQEHNQMSDKYAGSGLGLSITKSLVELMGGSITAESVIGHGTTFVVEMHLQVATMSDEEPRVGNRKDDIQPAEEKATKKYRKREANIEGTQILLCEDHPLNAEIARKLLEKEGCIVTLAENGKVGIEKFE